MRLGEFGLRVEQIHQAQVGRETGGIALEGLARDAAPRRQWPQPGEAIAEFGSGGANSLCRHQRMARSAGLPAPFARAGGRGRRRGNRVGRRRLEQPGQPVVGIVLRQSGAGKGCGKENCRGPAENRRGDGHGLRPRWRTLASIGSRRNGHLLCYRTINLQFVGVRLRKFASGMDSHNSNTMRLSNDGGFRPPPAAMQHHPRSCHEHRDPAVRSACSREGDQRWPPVPRPAAAPRRDEESGENRLMKSS